MDITPLFKACIKTVRTRNKTLGGMGVNSCEKRRPERPRCSFAAAARDLAAQVTRVRDLLLEQRPAYLRGVGAAAGAGDMTEAEREQLDVGAQRALHSCSAELRHFRTRSSKLPATQQMREYQTAVTDLLESYLKAVCKIHSELKALRVKRALDVRKLSRLEPSGPRTEVTSLTRSTGEDAVGTIEEEAATEDLSPEELQVLETENMELQSQLDSLTEEVKHIESKVLHIAQLQEIFTEKVLDQGGDVERVSSTVLGATENVREANEQIRKAIQRNAGLRVYVLFFLLVMSFSLLFLDWYND